MSWWAIGVLAVGAYGCKLFGVFVLARLDSRAGMATAGPLRRFPLIATLIPAALFAALIAVQTLDVDGSLRLDARAAGVAVSAVAVWRRAPFAVVVIAAMAVTAAIRWQTSG
jgi:branched chain amino acid efflux pump